MSDDLELLVGLSDQELEALAETHPETHLTASGQARLDELLERNTRNQLTADEQAELDRILARIDQLTILKASAYASGYYGPHPTKSTVTNQ